MTGKGIRADFTVTDSGKDTKITGVDQATIDAATTQYAAYVKDQAQQLVDQPPRSSSTPTRPVTTSEARELFPAGPQLLGAHRDRRRVLR